MPRVLTRLTGVVLLAALAASPARAASELAGLASRSGELRQFQVMIFVLCTLIAVVVLGAMLWSIVSHRRTRAPVDAHRGTSLKAEIAWTMVPIFILIAMATPAADTLLRSQESDGENFSVKVTGYQWKWEFEYPELGIRYSSLRASPDDTDVPLVVPAGARVQVAMTSADVNHGWKIPAFGRQQNAIPGHITEFSFQPRQPGFYRGECTEFCGPPETCVPIAVEALSAGEFTAWMTARLPRAPAQSRLAAEHSTWQPEFKALVAQGQVLHERNCAGCHQASGQGLRAAGFPPLAGTQVSKDEHIRIALHGRAGSAMAAFGSLLDDGELAAIVTYQRNAWGNDTGDSVVPAEVAAAR